MSPNTKAFSSREAFMVSQVNNFLKTLKPILTAQQLEELELVDIHVATVKLLGISKSSIRRCLIKTNRCNTENQINPTKPVGRPKIVCDSFTVGVIRRILYRFYEQKEYPTVKKLFYKCLQDPNFPKIGLNTFRRWLRKDCKFMYKRRPGKPVFLERNDIVAQREHYLRHIKHYRNQGYKIYYLDQTWTSPNQNRNRCWLTMLNEAEIQEFKKEIEYGGKVLQDVNGWTGGFMVKGGSSRIVVNHIGSEDGFLTAAEDIFLSKKDTSDYHNCMNGEHFEAWFQKVVSLLPEKSVVVLDRASYNRRIVPSTVNPKSYWNKPQIAAWMTKNNVPLPPLVDNYMSLLKASTHSLCKKCEHEERYIIEDIIHASGKDLKLLYLPVAHCELNPIELVWAYVKGKVGTLNKEGGPKYVLDLTKECMKLVTADLWRGCIKVAKKYEQKFWDRDRLIEKKFDDNPVSSDPNLCFVVNGSDTDSSSESEGDSDDSEFF